MIASRSGTPKLPRVIWRREAKRSMNILMDLLDESGRGDSKARRREVEAAVESLRYSPLRCTVVDTKDGLTFRRLVVRDRYFVYYVYTAPRGISSAGTLSIRAVKHAASQHPFLGVREVDSEPHAVLTTRGSPESTATA